MNADIQVIIDRREERIAALEAEKKALLRDSEVVAMLQLKGELAQTREDRDRLTRELAEWHRTAQDAEQKKRDAIYERDAAIADRDRLTRELSEAQQKQFLNLVSIAGELWPDEFGDMQILDIVAQVRQGIADLRAQLTTAQEDIEGRTEERDNVTAHADSLRDQLASVTAAYETAQARIATIDAEYGENERSSEPIPFTEDGCPTENAVLRREWRALTLANTQAREALEGMIVCFCKVEPGKCCEHVARAEEALAALADAPNVERQETERKSDMEFYWLIEAPGHMYLTTNTICTHTKFCWDTGPQKALRFYSREQADTVYMAVRSLDINLFSFEESLEVAKVAEHGFEPANTRGE